MTKAVGFIPMACVNDTYSKNYQFEERIWKEVKKGYCYFQMETSVLQKYLLALKISNQRY